MDRCDYESCNRRATRLVHTSILENTTSKPYIIRMCKKCYKEYLIEMDWRDLHD